MKLKQLASGLLIAFLLASCSAKKQNETSIEEFLMQVDSIEIPKQIPKGSPLSIRFYGMIGPDKSYQFSRIIAEADSVKTSLMLIGKRDVKQPAAEDNTAQYLKEIAYQFYPEDSNFVTIELINPGYLNQTKYRVEIE